MANESVIAASRGGNALVHIAAWLFGYAAAVAAAAGVTIFLMMLPSVVSSFGLWQTFADMARDLPGLVAFGVMITAIFGLPGFLIALFVATRRHWDRWILFAWAGTANAVLALVLYHLYLHIGFLPASILLPCLPGGFAGGAVYWFSAGRLLARRHARRHG